MAGFCIVMLMMGLFIPFLIIGLLIIFFILVEVVFNYFLESFALYRMCKNNNYTHPALAWIPFYNRIVLGDFADSKKIGYVVCIGRVIETIISFIIIYNYEAIPKDIGNYINDFIIISSLILFILNIILVHKIMSKTIPKAADLLTVLNVLTFGISKSIVLFALRNNKNLIKGEEFDG